MSTFPPGPPGTPYPAPSHQPNAYGQAPHGSLPPQPPKKKKKYAIVIALIVALCTGLGSCVSWCGYAMYKAQTPEGKRASAAQELKDEANLVTFIDKLGRARKNLPSKIEGDVRCAAKAQGFVVPIVDSIYLDAMGRPRTEWDHENLTALGKVRDSNFSERLLDRAADGAPKPDAGLHFFTATTDAKILSEKHHFYVIVVDEMTAPTVSGGDWTGGTLTGGLVVLDMSTEKPLCQAVLTAESSASISYGGGVRIKVRGIPGPKVGDTDLAKAVEKDFTKNVETAVREAAKRIGAS